MFYEFVKDKFQERTRPSFPLREQGTIALFELLTFLWVTFIKKESNLLEMLLGFNQTLPIYTQS